MAKKRSEATEPVAGPTTTRAPKEAPVPKNSTVSKVEAAPNESPKESSTTPTENAAPAKAKKTPWFRFTVMILFGIVYAWDLFSALSNFFSLIAEINLKNENRILNSITLIEIPWVPIIVNLLLPVVVFGLALWVSRKRSVGILAMVLLAGLGVVAAVSLSLIAYVRVMTPLL